MHTAATLAARWPLADGTHVRDALLEAYDDPARAYHDLIHLGEVLDRIDELDRAGEHCDRVAVDLAAWFHDAVYDTAPEPEARSAAWAARSLEDLEVSPVRIARVVALVEMTAHHRPDPADVDACVLSDADLAILAAPAERYAEYVAAVRREYASVPEPDFRAGRAAILRDLAAAPMLFRTAHARRHWEAPARANLTRELDGLTGAW